MNIKIHGRENESENKIPESERENETENKNYESDGRNKITQLALSFLDFLI